MCFAPDPWDDIWRNRHHIMSLLARNNQVLYVEPRYSARELCQRLRTRQVTLRALGRPSLTSVGPGLHVFCQPWYAPMFGREPLKGWSQGLRALALRRAMTRLHMRESILWLIRPDMDDVPGCCGERFLVYHIVDEYSGYAGLDAERAAVVVERERALIRRADLVLVTSEELLKRKSGINPYTYWVPNAVDYERFARAAADRKPPADIAGLARPWLGYVGAINDKLDLDLLVQIADCHTDGTLVLVGPVRVSTPDGQRGIAALQARPNVRLVGRVPVDQVAVYMAVCDVGLLPYRDNEWTKNIDPLKLYEYLACGLPVVSTDIPAVRAVSDLVYVAKDSVEFLRATRAVMAQDCTAVRLARQQLAAQNTWAQRVERISELIDEGLRRKAAA